MQSEPVYTASETPSSIGEEKEATAQAWVPWWDEENTLLSFRNAAPKLKSISPVWYRLMPDGELVEIPAKNKSEVQTIAQNEQVTIIPTVSNDDGNGFNPDSVSELLGSETRMEEFIETLLSEAKLQGYAGWDIDFEEVKVSDKEAYLTFMRRLSDALHEENMVLTTAVHAREGNTNDWEGSLAHDYEVLGELVDEMRIMAYDFHNKTTDPGPVTPLDRLDAVLVHAKETIPHEKIVLGLPLYGYEWNETSATNIEYMPVLEKVDTYNGTITRDSVSKELVITYTISGNDHTIYMQDKKSVEAKKKIAEKHGIEQFIFWKLGNEDEKVWK